MAPASRPPAVARRPRLLPLLLAAWLLVAFGVLLPHHRAGHHHEDDGEDLAHAVLLHDAAPGDFADGDPHHHHPATGHRIDLLGPTGKKDPGPVAAAVLPEAGPRAAAAAWSGELPEHAPPPAARAGPRGTSIPRAPPAAA